MSDLVTKAVLKNQKSRTFPDFNTGDTVSVSVRVKEGEKERIQLFKGVVLKMQGAGASRTFTVRKVSEGIGVERIFPFTNPNVEAVEIVSRGKARRSRLFYLRKLKGRAAKVRSDLGVQKEEAAPAAE